MLPFFRFLLTVLAISNGFSQSYMGYTRKATSLFDSTHTQLELIEKGEAVFIFSKEKNSKHYFINHIRTNKEGFILKKEVIVTEKALDITEHNFSTIKESEEKEPIISVKNSLNETLTLKINSIKYEIAPKESQIIRLKQGRFTFVVTSPGMLPHYGREIMEEFKRYEWDFYED